ncbi:hypothetical protein HDU76_012444, partial [Blyttiomyces sp. JEL0837]
TFQAVAAVGVSVVGGNGISAMGDREAGGQVAVSGGDLMSATFPFVPWSGNGNGTEGRLGMEPPRVLAAVVDSAQKGGDNSGAIIYVGGRFALAQDGSVWNVAKYNNQTGVWGSAGFSVDGNVRTMNLISNSRLLALGGDFNRVTSKDGATSSAALAIWNLTSSSLVNVPTLANESPHTATPDVGLIRYSASRNSVVIAGNFTRVGNMSCNLLCLWDLNEGVWLPLNGNAVSGGVVTEMEIFGNLLLIGGTLSIRNQWSHLIYYDFAKDTISTVSAAISGPVTALGADYSGNLYIAGNNATSGDAFLQKYDGSGLLSIPIHPESAVSDVLTLPAVSKSAIVVLTGSIILADGNLTASAVRLMDDGTMTPFVFSSDALGEPGFIAQLVPFQPPPPISIRQQVKPSTIPIWAIAIAVSAACLVVFVLAMVALVLAWRSEKRQAKALKVRGSGAAGDHATTSDDDEIDSDLQDGKHVVDKPYAKPHGLDSNSTLGAASAEMSVVEMYERGSIAGGNLGEDKDDGLMTRKDSRRVAIDKPPTLNIPPLWTSAGAESGGIGDESQWNQGSIFGAWKLGAETPVDPSKPALSEGWKHREHHQSPFGFVVDGERADVRAPPSPGLYTDSNIEDTESDGASGSSSGDFSDQFNRFNKSAEVKMDPSEPILGPSPVTEIGGRPPSVSLVGIPKQREVNVIPPSPLRPEHLPPIPRMETITAALARASHAQVEDDIPSERNEATASESLSRLQTHVVARGIETPLTVLNVESLNQVDVIKTPDRLTTVRSQTAEIAAAQDATGKPEPDEFNLGPDGRSSISPVWAVAQFTFVARVPDELGFQAGDRILVYDNRDPQWWGGMLYNGDNTVGQMGAFPASYVELESEDADTIAINTSRSPIDPLESA